MQLNFPIINESKNKIENIETKSINISRIIARKRGNIIVTKMKERKAITGFLRLFIVALTILIVQNNYAQAPAGYYDSATGTGAVLKTQLYNIIKGHTDVGYDGLYSVYLTSDNIVISGNNRVYDMYSIKATGTADYYYSHVSGDRCGSYSGESDCYNREHTFCDSWLGKASPQRSDAHHIVPTDGYVNNRRSSYPHGKVGSVSWTSSNGSKLGSSDPSTGYTGIVFEPIDEYKGDFARMYFYVATRYENLIDGWVSNGSAGEILNGTEYPAYKSWFVDLLLSWHIQDPVSTKEIVRNNSIYTYQHNRNPFIDHPEYVAKIWGGEVTNNPPSISGIILNPANPKSTDPVNVSATITDTDGTITSAVLKWGLVSGSLTNTITLNKTNGNSYSTVSAIPAKSEGVTVYYKIEVTDDSSDVTITSQYSYTVNDNFYNVSVIDEPFTNCPPTGWLTYSITSNKNWTCASGYELMNGYGGDVASNDWLISPLFNLDGYHNEYLAFKSWTRYTDIGNHPAVKIKYSTNYSGTGNPELASWTELSATWPTENSQSWTSSGNIDISSILGDQVYFAFQYTSTGIVSDAAAIWEIDSVKIIGDDIVTNNKPVISALATNPESPIAGQAVTISANITDSDGSIFSAKIKWGTVSGSFPNTITLSESGNVFSGVIPSQLAGTTVYYVVEATDNDNSMTITTQQQYFVSEIPNFAPVISDILINPSAPAEGESIVVSATITDSDGTVSSAIINYGTSAANYTQQVSMTKSGNTFSGTIPSQLSGTTIYFVIEAIDNDSEEVVSADNSFFVTAPHNNPPVISGIQNTPSNPDQNQSVTVSAEVTDSDGTISYSKIKWGTTQGVYTNIMNMTLESGTYSGIIPGQTGGTTIYFRIVAIDNDNDSTLTSEYSYAVNTPGNINPAIIELIYSPTTPTSTQTVSFSANITDSDGTIVSAKIKWGTSSGVYPNQISMSFSGSLFSGTIPSQANTTQVYFIVEATDNSGGITVSSEQNYTVTNPPNVNPQITNISFAPLVPTSAQQVAVSATITDSDGTITTASIKWGTSAGIYPNIISMSKNADVFSGSISARPNNTHIYFIIEAEDNDGGVSTSTAKDYLVIDPVNTLPQITNIGFTPVVPTSSQDVFISSVITDSDGSISSATVKWGITSGVYGNAVGMNSASAEEYSAIIPAQTDGTRVYFIIEAIDSNSGKTNSTERNYLVTDPPNQSPVISDVQINPTQPTNLDSVLVTASITDADGTISSALLKWKIGSEPTVYEKQMTLTESLYKTYVPANEAGKTIYFIIIATDNDNAQTSYMDGVYSVNAANSIEKTDDLSDIDIYPNPANEILRIFFHNNVRDVVVSILSIDGNTIYNKSFGEVKGEVILMLTHTEPGIYILHIKTQKNKISRKVLLK